MRGDIREIDLRPLCEGASVIFNLAAQTSHMGGQNDPLADIAVNAVAQVRLIQAAREAAPDAVVVHASTRQFYGRVTKLPVDESQPVAPPDANGVSKFAGEQYWLLEHRVRGRPVVSLRLTNCYGPRLRIRDARQTFLGIWIRSVLEDKPFEVWGGDAIARPDLCRRRDGGVPARGGPPDVPRRDIQYRRRSAGFVAGTGRSGRAAGRARRRITSVARVSGGPASIDIGSYHADDTAFRAATGWEPEVSLEEGIRRTHRLVPASAGGVFVMQAARPGLCPGPAKGLCPLGPLRGPSPRQGLSPWNPSLGVVWWDGVCDGASVRPIGLTEAPSQTPCHRATPNGWIAKALPLRGVHGGKAPLAGS